MGSKSDLVLIDTNVFVIDLRYKRDVKFNSNRAFLNHLAKKRNGFTTVINLLELCGILSFNLNEKQLIELWSYFQQKYQVAVLPFPSLDMKFPEVEIREIFNLLKARTSLGDALMISVAKKHTPFCRTMISWDDLHFETIFQGVVLTPEEFMRLVIRICFWLRPRSRRLRSGCSAESRKPFCDKVGRRSNERVLPEDKTG